MSDPVPWQQYLAGGGGSSTVCEGAGPEAMTVAVATDTGNGLPACTAPPAGSWDWTIGMGAIWMIWAEDERLVN